MKKYALGGILVLALAGPALAADEYYVVQDTGTKKCTIVEKKPTTTSMIVVGDQAVYKTKTEAESAMKTVKVCTSTN